LLYSVTDLQPEGLSATDGPPRANHPREESVIYTS